MNFQDCITYAQAAAIYSVICAEVEVSKHPGRYCFT
jgi:hypothetical protein